MWTHPDGSRPGATRLGPVIFRLLFVGVATTLGACGGDAPASDLAGRWTSRPSHHGESAEAVEMFGEDLVNRLHAAGNAWTPLVELDLRRDGTFTVRGALVPDAPDTATASGTWRRAGKAVRLDVTASADATGLASVLLVPRREAALVWRAATPAPDGEGEDDEVLLFRE